MKMQDWVAKNLTDKDFILITGSTSGIGHAYLQELSKLDCNIICVSNEREKLEEQKAEIESKTKSKITNFDLDLADIESVKGTAKHLSSLPIKVFINNAGIGAQGRFETHQVETLINVININITSMVILARAILPQMQLRNSGVVVHMASVNALVPIPHSQVYSATKAFCYNYALAMARENKETDIIFQVVLPGTTRTPFHDRQGANPQMLVMTPDVVANRALSSIDSLIFIPNKIDRMTARILPLLPKKVAIDFAGLMLKKRLGVK